MSVFTTPGKPWGKKNATKWLFKIQNIVLHQSILIKYQNVSGIKLNRGYKPLLTVGVLSAGSPLSLGTGSCSEGCLCLVEVRRLTGCYCEVDSGLSSPLRCEHRELFYRGWRTSPAQLDGICTQATVTPWSHSGKAPGPQRPRLAENSKEPMSHLPDAFLIFTWSCDCNSHWLSVV